MIQACFSEAGLILSDVELTPVSSLDYRGNMVKRSLV